MRYDEILRIYPDIENLFSGVSQLIHSDGVEPEMAALWAARWICNYIAKEHRLAVADKAHRFIDAICVGGAAKGSMSCVIQESFTNAPGRS